MPFESWLYLCLICLLGASSPGPSLLVIIKHSVADGRRAGIRASVGHGIGVFIYALASASGLSFILDTNPFLFSIIQILGALFLIWIGFSTVMASLKAKRESILQKESDDTLRFDKSEKLIDIGPIIRDQILTTEPIKKTCNTDCNGICQYCGKNLNKYSCNCNSNQNTDDNVWKKLKELV